MTPAIAACERAGGLRDRRAELRGRFVAAATRALAAYQRLTRGTSGPDMGKSA
ncbi:MAG TPA: hypothetical protein VFO16_04450 [Pseudonocardiaceae bacterium]|nr:hypothetical protein [Pseudonocardiaceae bacterium]